MKKNDLLTGICDQIGYNGEGIFHIEGTTFFVPYCLTGEKVLFKVLKLKGGVGYGKVEKILEKSPSRVQPVCPIFQKCGGCQLQHASYDSQLLIKENTVKNAFKKISAIDIKIDGVFSGEKIYGYRNKLQLPVREQDGKVKIGFFRENSHDVVETDECFIQPAWSKKIIKIFKDFVDGKTVTAYNENTKNGLVRHIVVREIGGEFIITVVANGNKIPCVNGLIDRLFEGFQTFSLYLNINKNEDNVIFGDKFILLYGNGKISLKEFGVNYSIGPESFMQVNAEVKKLLYSKVVELAGLDKDTVVIDGYSGAGVMTAMLAKNAKKAYGVEIIKEAVDSANDLAKSNGLEDKMQSICAPCEDVLPSIIEHEVKEGNKTVLVLDPPRKGVSLNVLKSALAAKPDKIIYVACSPQSLARDVGVLTGKLETSSDKILGLSPSTPPAATYQIEKTYLFDMFPQTKHVETLVVLSHKKPDGHIGVTVEFGEEDGQVSLADIEKRAKECAPKKKTTYKDIQAYIDEKYGFKVHTAYIAEVKRDLGLPMYDAPNAVEELKKPRQHPTKEMADAIKDALKHFEII